MHHKLELEVIDLNYFHHTHVDLWKHFFDLRTSLFCTWLVNHEGDQPITGAEKTGPNRVTNIWNSLPNKVSAPNLNAFKSRIDKFGANQEFVYDWQADIAGTIDIDGWNWKTKFWVLI